MTTRDDREARDPAWHPSGWSAVYAGGAPGEAGAELLGFTRETIQTEMTTRMMLTSAVGDEGAFRIHGAMDAVPHQRDDGLYWAWQLEHAGDRAHVPDFRPIDAPAG